MLLLPERISLADEKIYHLALSASYQSGYSLIECSRSLLNALFNDSTEIRMILVRSTETGFGPL